MTRRGPRERKKGRGKKRPRGSGRSSGGQTLSDDYVHRIVTNETPGRCRFRGAKIVSPAAREMVEKRKRAIEREEYASICCFCPLERNCAWSKC